MVLSWTRSWRGQSTDSGPSLQLEPASSIYCPHTQSLHFAVAKTHGALLPPIHRCQVNKALSLCLLTKVLVFAAMHYLGKEEERLQAGLSGGNQTGARGQQPKSHHGLSAGASHPGNADSPWQVSKAPKNLLAFSSFLFHMQKLSERKEFAQGHIARCRSH